MHGPSSKFTSSSSHGVSKDLPSIDINTARPLQATVTSEETSAAIGPGLPFPRLVPSLSFLPTSTVCSVQYLAGLLHPAANHGVHHVSDLLSVLLQKVRKPFVRNHPFNQMIKRISSDKPYRDNDHPQWCAYPSKCSPYRQPLSVTAASRVHPLIMPSRRCINHPFADSSEDSSPSV